MMYEKFQNISNEDQQFEQSSVKKESDTLIPSVNIQRNSLMTKLGAEVEPFKAQAQAALQNTY